MDVKYHVGCGKRNFGENWHHVDGGLYEHTITKDVFFRDACPSNFVDLIYSSHLIAYFSRWDALILLKSWFRILKEGGKLEIATPDFNKISYLFNNGICTMEEIEGPLYGQILMNKEAVYHKMAYSFVSLASILGQAGFVDIKLYDHKTTCHPNTGNREDFYDDHSAAYLHGELISLNVQAIKP